jgi:hypothetical protein
MNESEKTLSVPFKVPLTQKEAAEMRQYLKSTGRKAGPWLRVVVIDAIRKDQTNKGSPE